MTLKDLIQKVTYFGYQFSSCEIPLVNEQYVVINDIQLVLEEDSDGTYLIKMTIE